MTRRQTDDLFFAALRSLDSASGQLTQSEWDRAHAMRGRIIATSPESAPATGRTRRRRTFAVLAASAVGVTGLAGSLLLSNAGAYASWTASPQSLSPSDTAKIAATCRSAMDAPEMQRVAVAEARGNWAYVLLVSPSAELVCFLPRDQIGEDVSAQDDFFGNYDPDAAPRPDVAATELVETTSTQGSTDEGWFTSVEGYVGGGVTGVTLHTSTGLVIEASVSDGRFAAWWPSTPPSSSQPAETWSYSVEFRY